MTCSAVRAAIKLLAVMDLMHLVSACLSALTHIPMKIHISCNQRLQTAGSVWFMRLTLNQLQLPGVLISLKDIKIHPVKWDRFTFQSFSTVKNTSCDLFSCRWLHNRWYRVLLERRRNCCDRGKTHWAPSVLHSGLQTGFQECSLLHRQVMALTFLMFLLKSMKEHFRGCMLAFSWHHQKSVQICCPWL